MATKDIWGGALKRLGTRNTFVKVSEWNGSKLVHIRRYFKPSEPSTSNSDGFVPTQKGVALSRAEWEDLKGMWAEIDAALDSADAPAPAKKPRQF